jgi:hypothetical protein
MATIATHDGQVREPSEDPDVHRLLTVVDPPLEGRDVANLQRAVRDRLESRGLGHKDIPVPEHGKFTAFTELACIEAQYFLGLRSDTYLKRDRRGQRILTEGAQRVIREPETRDADQLARAKSRQAQLDRGPRYYAELAASMGLKGGRGVEDALKFAASHVGIKEHPARSNSGPFIDAWCRLAGYTSPVPWCGCFVNACLVAAGLPTGKSWKIGFTPAIVAHAKNGVGGWSWHEIGQRGDLALYDDAPGGPPAVHVEIVRERLSRQHYSTFGGNTSSGTAGSQSNGGMVARRDDRSTVGAFHIIGFARPPYKR